MSLILLTTNHLLQRVGHRLLGHTLEYHPEQSGQSMVTISSPTNKNSFLLAFLTKISLFTWHFCYCIYDMYAIIWQDYHINRLICFFTFNRS